MAKITTKRDLLNAVNRDSSPHNGSKASVSRKEIKFLKSIGFKPPKDGLLEWINLPADQEYVGYKSELLLN